ncbi:blood group Rh(CE) polypeptide [Alligator mississippiensis]|uniref:Blood group Rh(CE) polypeptide n=1 Tax=Alligator mississippiensis TaxID=8496 RepID=A0A151MMT9_ALLMI|nr:blood group Rh(CE) polypeptide [Alligator mississippiensis]
MPGERVLSRDPTDMRKVSQKRVRQDAPVLCQASDFAYHKTHTSLQTCTARLQLHVYLNQAASGYSKIYPAFQDVNVMVIFGFGFLLAYLKRYGFSSIGFNILAAVLGVQWTVFLERFLFPDKREKHLPSILTASMSVVAVLISAGAVLGKANPFQLICMAMVEMTAFCASRWTNVYILEIEEHVSLMHVHIFGTFFGLMVSWWLTQASLRRETGKEDSDVTSDLFSVLGTLFLWMFWPSFNSVLVDGVVKKRNAIHNTYYAIAVSAVIAFALSALTNKNGKLQMTHIHGATLAGGVALGFSAHIIHSPWIAMVLGFLAGVIAVLGPYFVKMCLNSAVKMYDTCDIPCMFGMPGLLGAIAYVILFVIYNWNNLPAGYPALIEVGSLSITILVAVIAGFITGILLKLNICKAPPVSKFFDDQVYWEFPHLAVGF